MMICLTLITKTSQRIMLQRFRRNGTDKCLMLGMFCNEFYLSTQTIIRLVFVHNPDTIKEGVKTKSREPSLALALSRAYGFTFFVAGIFKLVQDILAFTGPILLK